MRKRKLIHSVFITLLLLSSLPSAYAQRQKISPFASKTFQKTVTLPDSLTLARRDSLFRADSLHRADSVARLKESSLSVPAFSAARDSIVEVFSEGRKLIYYYGDVEVTYGDLKLKAERMDYDMNSGTVHAYGVLDTLTGEWTGEPTMTQGEQNYSMHELRYNFNSKKARITQMTTNEGDGIIHGKNIKMLPDKSVNMTNGKYTVCDAEHPHYYLGLTAAKVITKPNRKTVFGPAYLVVEDVTLPIALPFGFVPQRPKRATGMLMPSFGEERTRGFYIRDMGMYFVFGDYLDLSVTGSYYTLGSWAVDVNSRYKVNYKCNGSLSVTYSDDRTGEKGSADYNQSTNFAINWSHTQDSKANPGMSFSASVNFTSPSNNRFNARSVTEAVESQASSSISFSKNWNGKVNLSINALHSQNNRDSSYVFTLPNISLSLSTIYPFKRKVRVGKERFYEKISFGYSTQMQNKINFKASEFGNMDIGKKLQSGMTHNFSIGLPSFQLFKYITVNPSVSYGQNWFFSRAEAKYNAETDRVDLIQGNMFSSFGITQRFSGSVSASTRLYGLFNFGKYCAIQAIRHVISPSVSFSFSPEHGTYANGYRTYAYTDKNGLDKTYEYNIYSGQMYSAPGKGKSATASISIGNNLEAKVRDFADSTGAGFKKVKLIDQFSINTGYNFIAEEYKMNQVSLSMSTSLFDKIGISASAAFDPYGVDEAGKRVNRFAVTMGQGLTRFTNCSASLSYSISGSGKIDGNDGKVNGQGGSSINGANSYYQRVYTHPTTGEYIPGGWLYYTNPDVPWSVNLNYTLSYTKGYGTTESSINQTLGVSGNIRLTPRMNINATSGFDFKAMKLSTTQISATYDLHCFNISISWVPFGTWQSYSFRISANAAALSDLLRYKKSKSFVDNW